MKILALDSSLAACSVALLDSDRKPAITSLFKIAPMQQAQIILQMIDELLATHSLNFTMLDAIAYAAGPGSFTGVRIASSVTQAISFGAQLPVIKISSLATLAQTMTAKSNRKHILVAIDARVEQIYWAIYQVNEAGLVELQGEERVCLPNEISFDSAESTCGVGDGWRSYGDVLEKYLGKKFPSLIDTELLPNAEALAVLAQRQFELQNVIDFSQALPIYLR